MKVKKEQLVYIILTLLSILLIVIGVVVKDPYGAISLNIGLSIISTVIVYFILKILSDDPMKPILDQFARLSEELRQSSNLLSSSSVTGLIGVHNTRSNLPTSDWISRIKDCDGDISIFCYAMQFLVDDANFDEAIKTKLKEGKRIKILLGSPNGMFINARTAEEHDEGNIAERINRAKSRLEQINNDVAVDNRIEVRYHDTPLYASIYILGSKMIVTPQLHGQRGALAPVFELVQVNDQRCLYNKYSEMFNSIWNKSNTNSTSTGKIIC